MSWLRKIFSSDAAEAEPARGDTIRVAEVETVLERLRPGFRADGGDIRLVEVDAEGLVIVQMHGACHGCHAAAATLYGALEPELKRNLPWVSGLRAI